MGEDPKAVRQEIEQTRDRMGEKVDAIGHKVNVPERIGDAVAGKRDALKDRVGGVLERVTGPGSAADPEQVKHRARRVASIAQENPLGLALGAVAIGFLGGLLLPSTKAEDERMGSVADTVKDKAMEAGQEAVGRGRQVAEEAVRSAADTARDAGQRQAEEFQESNAQRVADTSETVQQRVNKET
jgi:hypothetical protein